MSIFRNVDIIASKIVLPGERVYATQDTISRSVVFTAYFDNVRVTSRRHESVMYELDDLITDIKELLSRLRDAVAKEALNDK